jgi:hypothetical protein
MKLIDHTKANVKKNWSTTCVVFKNFVEIVDAACLAGVSGYAIYVELHNTHKHVWDYALLYAGLAIALQAFILFVRALNKKPNA